MLHDFDKYKQIVSETTLQRLAASAASGHAVGEVMGGLAPARPLISGSVILGLMRLFDGAVVALVATLLYHFRVDDYSALALAHYAPVVLAAAVALPLCLQIAGLYSLHAMLRPVEQLPRLILGLTIVFAGIFALVFFAKTGINYSRLWLGTWFIVSLLALMLLRACAAALLRRWNASGQLDRRAVIVGGGQPAQDLIEALERSPDSDISVVGVFDDRSDERSPPVIGDHFKLGTIAELVNFARRTRVDLLIVTLPIAAEKRLLEVMRALWVLPVDIRLSAYTQKLRFRPRAYSYIGNVPFIDVFDKPLSDWNAVVKTVEDKLIAALALLVLSPLMALTALAIRLDSRGPVLFKQHRYGFNNELIEVYKFRSMYVNSCDARADRLVTRDDPRVTRVGRFIRKTSLDELPQLLNVLRGELSLVGPRPHAVHAKARETLYDEVVESYFARHKVKPGITGWAQVNGWRGETDTHEKIERRVEHDLYYIENWSVFFDLYILALTPFALLKTENAY